jgi:hypothetical protein
MRGNKNSGFIEGRMRIVHDNLARLRALKILDDKMSGMTNVDIAKKYGIHHITVAKALRRAVNDEILQDALDQITAKIVPRAVRAVEIAVGSSDEKLAAKVALEVLKGTNVLKRQGAPEPEINEISDSTPDSLELYIKKIIPNAPDHEISAIERAATGALPEYAPVLEATFEPFESENADSSRERATLAAQRA